MKTNMEQTFTMTVLAAALMATYGTALADDEIDQLIKPESSISVGVGNWSGDRHQQGIYDGMRKDGAYGILDIDIVKRDDATGTWLKFNAINLGLDNREVSGEWLRQGDVGVSLENSRITRDNPLTFNTGLQGIGTTSETISGTAGANALPFREVSLGTTRDLTKLGIYKNIKPGLDFKVSFKNEEKDGTRQWGLGSQPYFMVEPVDSNTKQIDASIEYAGEKFQLAGGYEGSWYTTNNPMVWGLVNGAAQPGTASAPNPTPLSQPLNNQAHQVHLNGGYTFTPSTRGTFKLSYGQATQDETLPSYNLAAPNNRFINAPSHLDGRLDTTLAQMNLTSRPIQDLSLLANLRYYDVSDKTPLAGFVGNNGTGAVTVHNTPHSFTKNSGKVEATYRLPEDFSVTGGIDLSKQDRTYPQFAAERYVPFRANISETTYRIKLGHSLSDTINGSLAYLQSKREGSGFTTTNEAPSDEISPIHIADRKRDKVRLSLDWAPLETASLQLIYENSKDDYSHTTARPYGLVDGSAILYSLDATYAPSDDWKLTAWYSHDETNAHQFTGRWSRTTEEHEADKDANLKENGDSVGMGALGKVSSKLNVGVDLQWTQSRNSYNEDVTLTGVFNAGTGFGTRYPTSGGVTAVPLPDIESTLIKLNLFAEYAVSKSSDLRANIVFEQWKTNDWTWTYADGTPFTYGTTVDGTTVTAKKEQISNFISIRYIYKFQ